MRVAETRNGVVEGGHDLSVAVFDTDGVILSSGDIDRPFYIRSSAKPFQAAVSQLNGADLDPLRLALAAASHQGFPVHIAMVEVMLDEAGLDSSDLGCPPSFPASSSARDLVIRAGFDQPSSLWHNCSGKHAAMLRACVANGWDLETYLDPGHPLQKSVAEMLAVVTARPGDPVGIDGCGAPVTTVTTEGLARAFHRLGNDPAFSDVFIAMHRYPGMTRGVGMVDDTVARWWNAVAKIGAIGCLGVALGDGVGIAVKSWDGTEPAIGVVLMETLRRIGLMTTAAEAAVADLANPPVLGGGQQVGRLEIMGGSP